MKTARFALLLSCVLLLLLPVRTDSANDSLAGHRSPKQIDLSLEYGYSRMIRSAPDALHPFYRELNSNLLIGSHYLLSVSAYLHHHIGIGLFYSRYISHASLNVYALSLGQKTFSGPYIDRITVNYFGPVIGIKSSVWDKYLVFVGNLRPGMVLYFEDISFAEVMAKIFYPVFGLGGSIGMNYLLKSGFGIGVSLNGLYATIPAPKRLGEPAVTGVRNISRIDLNLGITFQLARRHKP